MGVRFPSVQTNTFIGPFPANATETVVLTTPPLTLPLDSAVVLILWDFSALAGTSVTSFVLRIRRGATTAGTLVTTAQHVTPAVAGTISGLGGCYFDTPGAVAGQQYSLTCVQTAATGASTFNDAALLAFAL
jgi:hypothetical protein